MPAIQRACRWPHQFLEEVNLIRVRVVVRGKLAGHIKSPEVKGGPKRADFELYSRSDLSVAVIEARQVGSSVGHRMQEVLAAARPHRDRAEALNNESAVLAHCFTTAFTVRRVVQ